MQELTVDNLLSKINELQNKLEESEQLIEAIKSGEVDAFAIINENNKEIYTLQSGDYVYRVLIEEFNEGALNITEDGLIVYTNQYFSNLVKLPVEKLLGFSFYDFVDDHSRDDYHNLFTKALNGSSKGEINLCIENNLIPVYISLTSLQPQLASVGVIITDFTEKKKNEETILKYQHDLEMNNYELTNRNAELASFSYIASHDLQEPLRKIQTFARLLLEKEQDRLSESAKDYLERMYNSSQRMKNLINDLLTYSKTNSVERKFIDTDFNEIITEVKKDLREELEQKNISLNIDVACRAEIIPFQFKQLFYNLLSNSIKFSSENRPAYINIKSVTDTGKNLNNKKLNDCEHYCHITIRDNGIGFEPEFKNKIFELFQRLHGRGMYKGTGIGLAIVKKIIDNHNGFINASGELDKGAEFDIYIPVKHLAV